MNPGFDPKEIETLRKEIERGGRSYVLNEEEPQGDEFAHFFFLGKHEGQEVICDAVLYTLRLEHSSQVYEMADQRAQKQFPSYKPLEFEVDARGELQMPEELDEEVELFKAEVMMELEEEEAVKVQEYVSVDTSFDYGIGIEACLNVEEITPDVIEGFIADHNADQVKLDDTYYAFHSDYDDDDEV
ncbi:MAG: hypothetical protein WBA12_13725 [Catalinimonas sp.]